MVESNSKRQKASEENDDRISSLPDDVLNHILSYLPIKTTVATGRLSRQWQHLWKHLHVLDFNEYDDYHRSDNRKEQLRRFVVLVNNVLHRNRHGIRKMRLTCAHSLVDDDNFRSHTVDTWVRSVIGPQLEELELDLDLFSDDFDEPLDGPDFDEPLDGTDFKLPLSLFTCPNLVSLRHASVS
uniref:Cyclin-like F-box n=1 Tax=Medicago truncatula TaxID=3880 RepID=Q2HS92_MEDTR|nr:Cyclin-like F-box [Medicago truncatula]